MLEEVRCSFCGKASTDVRYIVAQSLSTAICNECALLTIDTLLERKDPEIADILERQTHLLTLENPCVVVRDIRIAGESEMPILLLLGFLPTFIASTTPQLRVEIRLDIAQNHIRLAIRTTQADRAAVQDSVTLYGDILTGERSIDEVPMTANARDRFLRLTSVCEAHGKEDKGDPPEVCAVSIRQELGWVLTEDWDDEIGQ